MERLNNLDYLRGLAAFGIMIFHYLFWTLGEFSSDTIFGRIGTYGVSIFYVLSGLTLYYVYHKKMGTSKTEILAFGKKRFFRIYPLLWLATIAAIIIKKQFPDATLLFLNLTGLFGLLKWDGYFATGAWSIGNELVFYLFFPVFIILMNKSKLSFIILSICIFFIYVFFAFSILKADQPLSSQWTNYVNPLNQLFLFLSGYLIGMIFTSTPIAPITSALMLLLGLTLFIFYPSKGDRIALVTGIARMIFTISCLLICISFYKTNFKLPKVIDRPLTLLGEASYSIYLLHPIVYTVVQYSFLHVSKSLYSFPVSVRFFVAVIATILLSYLVYKKFEKFFMRLGKMKKIHALPSTLQKEG